MLSTSKLRYPAAKAQKTTVARRGGASVTVDKGPHIARVWGRAIAQGFGES
jgi:hypothetical protein